MTPEQKQQRISQTVSNDKVKQEVPKPITTSICSDCIAEIKKTLSAIEKDKLYRTTQGWHSDDIAHAFRELLAKISPLT